MIGERVKKWREKRGLTQPELAKKANISQSMVAMIEKDKTTPSLTLTRKIAFAMNIPVSYLIEKDEEKLGQAIEFKELYKSADEETKNFLNDVNNLEFIVLAKDIKKENIQPKNIRNVLDIIKKMKE